MFQDWSSEKVQSYVVRPGDKLCMVVVIGMVMLTAVMTVVVAVVALIFTVRR